MEARDHAGERGPRVPGADNGPDLGVVKVLGDDEATRVRGGGLAARLAWQHEGNVGGAGGVERRGLEDVQSAVSLCGEVQPACDFRYFHSVSTRRLPRREGPTRVRFQILS